MTLAFNTGPCRMVYFAVFQEFFQSICAHVVNEKMMCIC
jgi:hypothetical protein